MHVLIILWPKFHENIMWPQIFHARPPPYLEHSGLVSTCQSWGTSSGKHWQGGIGPISAGLWVVQPRRPQYPISTKYYFKMCENFINFSSIGHRPISWSSNSEPKKKKTASKHFVYSSLFWPGKQSNSVA